MPGEGWKVFLAQGAFEDNAANTFGAYGWFRLPGLQQIYRDILLRHFPHHVAVTRAHVGNVLYEVFGNYCGMAMYHGGQAVPGMYTPALPFTFARPAAEVTLDVRSTVTSDQLPANGRCSGLSAITESSEANTCSTG